MRAFLRLSLLRAAGAAALAPAAAHAQRSEQIPPLYVSPVAAVRDTAPAPRDTAGLRIRVEQAPSRAAPRETIAPAVLLPMGDAARIFARLPGLPATAAADSFAFPARTLAAPRTGRVVLAAFPPPDSAPPPRPSGPRTPAPLSIVRAAPQGEVPVGAEVTVTFSQPMVPLASVGAVQSRPVPVRLTPMPEGSWRWLDVRTLVFTPRGRMPAATEYTVAIPAGTRAETGGALSEAATWTFSTPRLSAAGGRPYGDVVRRDPVIVLRFDQRIDRAAVLARVQVRSQGQTFAVRAATAAEIAADPTAHALSRGADSSWIAFRPVQPLPYDAAVEVVVPAGTPSAEGPLPTRIAQTLPFRTYGPLRVTEARCAYGDSCRPGTAFVVHLSNPLDTAAFTPAWVRAEPVIPGMSVALHGSSLMVGGRTQPNTRYTVIVGPQVRDQFGQTLGTASRHTFNVGAPAPGLVGFEQNNGVIVLDPAGPRRVSVFSHDYPQLRIRIHRVQPEDWLAFRESPGEAGGRRLPGTPVVDRIVSSTAAAGELVETVVDLDSVLGGRPGQLVVGVEGRGQPGSKVPPHGVYAWVQSTRIGLAAFAEADALTAWATSLVDGTPVAGASVSLGGRAPAIAAEARADAAGLAVVPLPSRPDVAEYLVARAGDDVAVLPGGWVRHGRDPELIWYGVTDRNLYRPGEEASFKGWVRRFLRTETGGLGVPDAGADSVRWRVTDPRGNEIAAGRSALTALGGFDGRFAIPAGSNLGVATIQLALGSQEFSGNIGLQVQEFRRPEFEVAAAADEGPHFVGDSAEVSVRASYFAGGALPGAPVSWAVHSEPASFTPPGWGEWRFGVQDAWYGYGGPGVASTYATQTPGETDADGRHALRIHFERAVPPSTHALAATATVQDLNRQPWTTSTRLLVHPAGLYAGLRAERGWVAAGEPVEVRVIVVDLEGKVAAGRPVEVVATRLEWRSERGRWGEVAADSARCSVVSGPNPVPCTFATARNGGRYRVAAVVRDAQGRPSETRTDVWAFGGAWVHGPGDDADNPERRVTLVPDRERYAPGDTARVLVQLPFWPAEGVLSIRREGLVRTQPVRSEGPTFTVDVPVGEGDIPNLYVQVDAVGAYGAAGRRQPTARGTDFATGSVMLAVPPGPRTLTVVPVPADSALPPDAQTSVGVEVRGADGRPVADAEVAVVVVDEAVLALTGYSLANPVELFYPQWTPGVMDTYLRGYVLLADTTPGAPGLLRGVVVDARTRQPLAGVTVEVEGTALRTVTDASGRFRLASLPAGQRTVLVSMHGVRAGRYVVQVGTEPLPEVRVDLALEPSGAGMVLMESVTVTGLNVRARVPLDIGTVSAADIAVPPPGVVMEEFVGQGTAGGVAAGASPIMVRANFAALALWAPVVRTDARGRAQVPFTLPSNLTRYRVMAVAVSGGTRYGAGESAITARQPLMARPSAPRFLNFGDRFELPVIVQNQTDAAMEVEVVARGEGVRFTEPGKRVRVPANDRVEVRIAAEAVRAGTAHLQVAAVAGPVSDAATLTLPVYTPATAEAFATYGSIAGDSVVDLPLQVPDDAIPAFGGLEVTTTSTALQELTDAFLYLVRYPYECAEQLASRILAVAALRDVLTEFRAEGLPPPQALADSVARDLAALQSMQVHDGGFAFWPGREESWPFVSVHVTHALVRARGRGYAVPGEMLERSMGYVRRVDAHVPPWYSPAARYAVRAYAAYVRDLAGDGAVDGELRALFGQARMDTIPLEVAGWLLSAVAERPAFAAERGELLRIVNNRATETASTATFATAYEEGEYLLLHSSRRTDAVVLEALLRADPQSELATRTVRGLLGHRVRGRWNNTQENSWVLLAVDRYFRVYEGQTPEFVARLWLGERFAGEQRFAGRSADRLQLDVPMRVLAGDDPRSLTIGKEGPGRLYYRAGLRYAPRGLDLLPVERGFAVERTYEPVDDPADVVRGADGRWTVRAGARVRVTVTVTAPSRRVHVAMVDPLPAGFEAVNTALRGTQATPPEGGRVRQAADAPWEQGAYWWWWRSWYEHQNLRDDRAEAFTSLLPAGVYTYTYVARATTPGLFIVPPPRAEEMYSPETFGRGATDRVIVEGGGESRE